MEYLYALFETYKEKPMLIAFTLLLIAIGYGAVRLNRFAHDFAAQARLVQQREKAFEQFIDSGWDRVNEYSYQGDDVNLDDFYDLNYRNNNEAIIAVCNEIINEASEKQLSKDEWEELDFFYYRRAEAHEFLGNYELAINDYQQSLKITEDEDEETQQRINICYEKLKGNNDKV